MPERARLERASVVGRCLPDEVEPARRARARRVEEVAVAAHRVGPLEAGAELAAAVVVEERRAAAAPRERPLLEPEHEDGVEPPRARAQQVEHGDAPGLAGRRRPHLEPPERVEHVGGGERPPSASSSQASSSSRSLAAPNVRRSSRACSPAGGCSSPYAARTIAGSTVRTPASGVAASRSSRSATSGASRRRSVSSTTRPGSSMARPRSRPSAKSTLVRATPGVRASAGTRRARRGRRRAQANRSSESSACPSGVVGKRSGRLDRVRDPERRRTRSRAARASARPTGTTSAIVSGAAPPRSTSRSSSRDELERAAQARAGEEADGAADRRRCARCRSKSARSRWASAGAAYSCDARRQLLDRPAASAARSSAVRASEANAARPGSYGSETWTSARPGERLEQRPLGRGQVLEAVGEDRLAVPRRRGRPERARTRGGAAGRGPRARARSSSRAVGGVERGELAVEVAPGRAARPRAPRAPRAARRRSPRSARWRAGEPPLALHGGHRAPRDAGRAAPATRRGASRARRRRSLEQVVERPDRAAEQAAAPREQVALDRGRRPPGSARSGTARPPGAPDSARAGARPCPHSRAPRRATSPPGHRRVAPRRRRCGKPWVSARCANLA